jgi:hypothetical protein
MKCLSRKWRGSFIVGGLFMALGFGVRASDLDRLETLAGQTKEMGEFLADTSLSEAYFKALKTYQGRDHFKCESFTQILDKIRKLVQTVPEMKQRLWARTHWPSITIETLPTADQVLVTSSRPVRYSFRPMPRRFHALWIDPSAQGCLTDNCKKADVSSPDRWAAVLEASEFYVVEKDGVFTDLSLLISPIYRDGEIYPLVSLGGGPLLLKTMRIIDPITRKLRETTLFKEWMAEMLPFKHKGWKNYVMLQRGASQDSFLGKVEPSQPRRVADPVLGKVNEFLPLDPLADGMQHVLPRACLATDISTIQSFLGVAPGNKNSLVVVNDYFLSPLKVTDPNSVTAALSGVSYGNLGAFGSLSPLQSQQVQPVLNQLFRNSPDAEVRAKAGVALAQLNPPPAASPQKGGARSPASAPSAWPLAPTLSQGLSDPSPAVRAVSAEALASQPNPPGEAARALASSFNPGGGPGIEGTGLPKTFPWNDPGYLLKGMEDLKGNDSPDALWNQHQFTQPGQIPIKDDSRLGDSRLAQLETARLAFQRDKKLPFSPSQLDEAAAIADRSDSRNRNSIARETARLLQTPGFDPTADFRELDAVHRRELAEERRLGDVNPNLAGNEFSTGVVRSAEPQDCSLKKTKGNDRSAWRWDAWITSAFAEASEDRDESYPEEHQDKNTSVGGRPVNLKASSPLYGCSYPSRQGSSTIEPKRTRRIQDSNGSPKLEEGSVYYAWVHYSGEKMEPAEADDPSGFCTYAVAKKTNGVVRLEGPACYYSVATGERLGLTGSEANLLYIYNATAMAVVTGLLPGWTPLSCLTKPESWMSLRVQQSRADTQCDQPDRIPLPGAKSSPPSPNLASVKGDPFPKDLCAHAEMGKFVPRFCFIKRKVLESYLNCPDCLGVFYPHFRELITKEIFDKRG